MADPFTQIRVTLESLEQEQRERFRERSKPKPPERRPAQGLSIPALDGGGESLSPLARADIQAAYGMVETINRMQSEGSISAPLLRGDR